MSWYLIPSVLIPLIIVGAVASRLVPKKRGGNQAYDPKTGIGRGAPGFQTGVKRVAVTPEIAARLRAGENVPQEEIDAAIAQAQAGATKPKVDNEWLPPSVNRSPAPSKRKGRRG